MSDGPPPLGRLEVELVGILALAVVCAVLAFRGGRTLALAREQLRDERDRRLEAEDHAEAKDRAVDGALATITQLKEDHDRRLADLEARRARPEPAPEPDP